MAFNWGKFFDIGSQVAVPLITAAVGSSATKKAAKATEDASREAAEISQRQYEQTRADAEPWRKAGEGAVNMLSDLSTPGKVAPETVSNYLTNLPGYQFNQKEGEKAWERKYSSRSGGAGGLQGGGAMKDLMRWNSERLAGPAFQNWQGGLRTLAGYGPAANNTVAQYGASNAGTQGRMALLGADANAAGSIGAANLWTGAGKNILDNVTPYGNYLQTIKG